MSEDYYSILGITREATAPEIDKAHRRMASKPHPDKNPDDKSAKEKFQKLQAAYDVLKDPEKREMYDRYGASFEQYRAGAGGPRPGAGSSFEEVRFEDLFGGRGGFDPFTTIFEQFSGGAAGTSGPRARGGKGQPRRGKGPDSQAEVTIPFTMAVSGGELPLTFQRGDGSRSTIQTRIPPGVEDGQNLRLKGQGEAGFGGKQGDLVLTIHIEPHPSFTRQGKDLFVKVPVTLAEACLGAKVDVPTPKGTVTLRIPPGSSSGTKLRIKGHGVPERGTQDPGDLFAELQIRVPKELTDEERELLKHWDERHPLQPREDLRW